MSGVDPVDPTVNIPADDATPLIASVYSHYFIFGMSIFAILWGGLNALWVSLADQSTAAEFLQLRTFWSVNALFLILLG